MTTKTISGVAFDAKFDAGEDIDEHIDWSTARRPGLEKRGATSPTRWSAASTSRLSGAG